LIVGGAAVAVSTPITGRRLRRAIRHKVEDCSGQIAEVTTTLRETGGQIRHQGEKLVREAEKPFASA